ncbi:hypothetical protein QJS10_CPB04g01411 [Acorus calamus]|uniref:Uncharacterized protein n=1 Tax=Acorus calamus TaxID=4465 RepID=A0AAV9EZV7_ACOCL|nr:hypothetical protein QJS10_CPB04g01411 [Acorus calamus]
MAPKNAFDLPASNGKNQSKDVGSSSGNVQVAIETQEEEQREEVEVKVDSKIDEASKKGSFLGGPQWLRGGNYNPFHLLDDLYQIVGIPVMVRVVSRPMIPILEDVVNLVQSTLHINLVDIVDELEAHNRRAVRLSWLKDNFTKKKDHTPA